LACHLHIDSDPDPDPAYHFDAELDPIFHFVPARIRNTGSICKSLKGFQTLKQAFNRFHVQLNYEYWDLFSPIFFDKIFAQHEQTEVTIASEELKYPDHVILSF
jgi:hypothetical protein